MFLKENLMKKLNDSSWQKSLSLPRSAREKLHLLFVFGISQRELIQTSKVCSNCAKFRSNIQIVLGNNLARRWCFCTSLRPHIWLQSKFHFLSEAKSVAAEITGSTWLPCVCETFSFGFCRFCLLFIYLSCCSFISSNKVHTQCFIKEKSYQWSAPVHYRCEAEFPVCLLGGRMVREWQN